jgi:hypothetical protein
MQYDGRLRFPKWTIYLYLTVVGGVSAYDWLLTVIYASCLHTTEENPVGRWLMGASDTPIFPCTPPPYLNLFLGLKLLGTCLVLSVMYQLFRRYRNIGHPVAIGVSMAQLALAVYLTVG